MMLGLSLSTFTTVHVIISLIAIATGVVVLAGMLSGKSQAGWVGWFLATSVLTSVTGFMFPFTGFLPSHGVGVIALVILAVSLLALYAFHLAGAWRSVFVVSALISLYLNVFVLVAQGFLKVPALNALAPQGSEPPFLVAQIVVLAIFVGLIVLAVKRFRPAA